MNRSELIDEAKRLGISEAAYSLDGGAPSEKYTLSRERHGWAIYYSERGFRNREQWFDSESAAYKYLLELLVRDPTTRSRK